jgi:hypothetical protein
MAHRLGKETCSSDGASFVVEAKPTHSLGWIKATFD